MQLIERKRSIMSILSFYWDWQYDGTSCLATIFVPHGCQKAFRRWWQMEQKGCSQPQRSTVTEPDLPQYENSSLKLPLKVQLVQVPCLLWRLTWVKALTENVRDVFRLEGTLTIGWQFGTGTKKPWYWGPRHFHRKSSKLLFTAHPIKCYFGVILIMS